MIRDEEIIEILWRGGQMTMHPFAGEDLPSLKPIDGPIFFFGRGQAESLMQRGLIERCGKTWMSGSKFHKIQITDAGRVFIGKPTAAEASRVEVSGPDVRKKRTRA